MLGYWFVLDPEVGAPLIMNEEDREVGINCHVEQLRRGTDYSFRYSLTTRMVLRRGRGLYDQAQSMNVVGRDQSDHGSTSVDVEMRKRPGQSFDHHVAEAEGLGWY